MRIGTARNRDVRDIESEVAKAYSRVARIRELLGEYPNAAEAFQVAVSIFAALVEDYPEVAAYQRYLAEQHIANAWRLCWARCPEEAEEALREGRFPEVTRYESPRIPSLLWRLLRGQSPRVGSDTRLLFAG